MARLALLDFDESTDDPPYPETWVDELTHYMAFYAQHADIYSKTLGILIKDATVADPCDRPQLFNSTVEAIMNGGMMHLVGEATCNDVGSFLYFVLDADLAFGIDEGGCDDAMNALVNQPLVGQAIDRLGTARAVAVLVGDKASFLKQVPPELLVKQAKFKSQWHIFRRVVSATAFY